MDVVSKEPALEVSSNLESVDQHTYVAFIPPTSV